MDYNTSKLFNKLNNDLLNFRFRKCSSRLNVLQKGDHHYPGFCLGIIFMWAGKGKKSGQRYGMSLLSETEKYKELLEQSKELMKSYDPTFECTTIQYNKNYKISKHIDANNVGESYILGCGNYIGGELIVYDENDKPTYIDINHKFYKFNGSKYYHETADFIGDRISLVFFKLGEKHKNQKKE